MTSLAGHDLPNDSKIFRLETHEGLGFSFRGNSWTWNPKANHFLLATFQLDDEPNLYDWEMVGNHQ